MVRVLIAEDNPFFREAFRASLHERIPSAVIEEVGNGEEALQRINGMPPDLIFTDMRLAGMNGLELALAFFLYSKRLPGLQLPPPITREIVSNRYRTPEMG